MIHLQRNLLNTSIILLLDNASPQLGLSNLSAQHDQVQHQQQLEQRTVRHVQMSDRLQRQITLLLLHQLVRTLLHQLHIDTRPVISYIIALKHHQISVLNVQLNRSYILHHQQTLTRHKLNNKLVLTLSVTRLRILTTTLRTLLLLHLTTVVVVQSLKTQNLVHLLSKLTPTLLTHVNTTFVQTVLNRLVHLPQHVLLSI